MENNFPSQWKAVLHQSDSYMPIKAGQDFRFGDNLPRGSSPG